MSFPNPPKPNCCNGYCDGRCVTHTVDGVCVASCVPLERNPPEHVTAGQVAPAKACQSGITCADCCRCISLNGYPFCNCVATDHAQCGLTAPIRSARPDFRFQQVAQGARVPGLNKAQRRVLRQSLRR